MQFWGPSVKDGFFFAMIKTKPGFLVLENGVVLEGWTPFEGQLDACGEVVFTTGMTGYPESLTDPSYSGQILVFTYPLLGNYGVSSPESWESKKIHARAVIVQEMALHPSHHSSTRSLIQWLKDESVPFLSGIDTRFLTKMIRSKGTLLGAVTSSKGTVTFEDPNQEHLVPKVSLREKKVYGQGAKRIIVVDCGMKESMIRELSRFPLEIVRVPYNYDYTQECFDGVFLSNGPGDPIQCVETVAILKKAFQIGKPIFGVCLGSQLMALAAGGTTAKLKFGHRGHNQPCVDTAGKCYITSQNHGYAVQEESLPAGWEVLYRNLNDGSVEGIAHTTLPFFAVQFHPEACPGPTDTRFLFERFYACL